MESTVCTPLCECSDYSQLPVRESYTGRYPFMKQEQAVPVGCDGARMSTNDYWAVSYLWPGLVFEFAPWPSCAQIFVSPGGRGAAWRSGPCDWPTSYYYSHSFVARPQLWASVASDDPQSLLQPTRRDEVRAPAQKCLTWDFELAYALGERVWENYNVAEPTGLLMADGHAELRIPARATPPWTNPLSRSDLRLHNTPDGVFGHDY
jgi:hypothetical protein